jgi:hypothetical protein
MGVGRGVLGSMLAVGAAAAMVSGIGDGTSAAQTEPIPVVDCDTRIQVAGNSSPQSKSIAIGPVVFNGLNLYRKMSRAAFRPRGSSQWGAVKSPYFIEAGGASATVTLAEQHRGRALVDVGLDAGGSAQGMAVRIEPCPAGFKGRRWTVFLAGFKVKGPMCLRVSVQVEGEPAPAGPRKVAVGKRSCRGK